MPETPDEVSRRDARRELRRFALEQAAQCVKGRAISTEDASVVTKIADRFMLWLETEGP